jgi:hypothetical protein
MNRQVRKEMMKMIYGYYVSFSIGLCAKLEIPELLQNKAQTIEELSEKTEMNKEALLKMMRLLVANNIFTEISAESFKNNEMSKTLISELKYLSQLHVSQVFQESWRNLEYSIKNEKSATKYVTGNSFYNYLNLDKNQEIRDIFDKAMVEIQSEDGRVIHDYYDFSIYKKIYDIGGGSGKFLSSIKRKYEHISATLFDTEKVINKINPNSIADISLLKGDFFESIPNDGDLYILRHIIHNWGDNEAVQILEECVSETSHEARFLVIEMVLDTDSEKKQTKEEITIYRDIHMLVALEGKQRTLKEFEGIFSSASLEIEDIILLPSGMNIFKLKKTKT